MGGWSSFNKYSLLGGLRSAAQIVSYEIPLTLSVVGLMLLAGTMSLNSIVAAARAPRAGSPTGTSFRQPLGFLIFAIAATAEANRTPFDLTEADSRDRRRLRDRVLGHALRVLLLRRVHRRVHHLGAHGRAVPGRLERAVPACRTSAGSSTRAQFGIGLLFIVAPGAAVVGTLLFAAPFFLFRSKTRWWVALIIGFVLFNVVVGGVLGLWAYINFDWVAGLFWFLGKTFTLVFVFVWMRGTLPRVRIDQLMGFAWKWLLPASLLNLFVTAVAVIVVDASRGAA